MNSLANVKPGRVKMTRPGLGDLPGRGASCGLEVRLRQSVHSPASGARLCPIRPVTATFVTAVNQSALVQASGMTTRAPGTEIHTRGPQEWTRSVLNLGARKGAAERLNEAGSDCSELRHGQRASPASSLCCWARRATETGPSMAARRGR